jgi:carbon-monoxide dehydrogenase medium subunit
MKPPPFEYAAPSSLPEALEWLEQVGFDARPLAGGQSLIPMMNFRLARPAVLVDLNGVDALAFLHRSDDGALRIGAMTRQRAVERSDVVARSAPLLREALGHVAHPQIRNRGTIGGSLAHADPASELPAVMQALGARFRVESSDGGRWIPAADFFLGPFMAALGPGELLVEIEVPARSNGDGWAFEEVARRAGDYALTGVAAQVRVDAAGVCTSAALAYVNAAATTVLAPSASAKLLPVSGSPRRRASRRRPTATLPRTSTPRRLTVAVWSTF